MEEDKEKNSGFSFMQEKIKEKPVYANPLVKKALRCILGGALFGGTALLIWALALPRINNRMEKNEIQEIQIPEEMVDSETDDKDVRLIRCARLSPPGGVSKCSGSSKNFRNPGFGIV